MRLFRSKPKAPPPETRADLFERHHRILCAKFVLPTKRSPSPAQLQVFLPESKLGLARGVNFSNSSDDRTRAVWMCYDAWFVRVEHLLNELYDGEKIVIPVDAGKLPEGSGLARRLSCCWVLIRCLKDAIGVVSRCWTRAGPRACWLAVT